MEYLKAVILGIVQGASEFLPISSSGHLSVFQHFMGLGGDGSLALTVFLHIGTLVAVIAVYYKTFFALIKELALTVKDLFTGKLFKKGQEISEDRHMLYMMILSCVPLLFLFIPVGGGRNVKDIVETLSNDDDILVEGVFFLITAILLFTATSISKRAASVKPAVKTADAWWVGFAQFLAACFPGLSRSGSTIATGMICGVDKDYMVRYSFVLGTPAVLAASIVEIKDTISGGALSLSVGPIIVGVIVAAVTGVAAIKLLEWLVNKDKFKFFGYYCLILSAFVIAAGLYETFAIV